MLFDGRLPEAFGGYDRRLTKYPVQYPTACSPQAWSTGTPLLLLRTMLGLGYRGRVVHYLGMSHFMRLVPVGGALLTLAVAAATFAVLIGMERLWPHSPAPLVAVRLAATLPRDLPMGIGHSYVDLVHDMGREDGRCETIGAGYWLGTDSLGRDTLARAVYGAQVSLESLRGKPVVLYFYPKDDTSGCTRQAQDFTAMANEFAAAGVRVVGVSRDPMAKHEKFIDKYALAVPLASDEDGRISDAFGTWVQKSMYGRKYMGMERSTFLIGADGRVLREWRKVKVPGHATEVLKSVREMAPA